MPSRYFLVPAPAAENVRQKHEAPRLSKELPRSVEQPPTDLSNDLAYDLDDAELDDMLRKGELTEEHVAALPDLASFDDDAVEHEYDERLKEAARAANESSPATKKHRNRASNPRKKAKISPLISLALSVP